MEKLKMVIASEKAVTWENALEGSRKKFVGLKSDWAAVLAELEGEDLKQKIYDNTLFSLLGDLKGKRLLDYGAGPGVVAERAAKLGAAVKVFDVSEDMRKKAGQKVGAKNVYADAAQIPDGEFDAVVCNLVVCIVPDEAKVVNITKNIKRCLRKNGRGFIGFCNPRIFDLPESVIDFRIQTGNKYWENHEYEKIKKEGGYRIVEMHRPLEWYEKVFGDAGLKVRGLHFTPEYEMRGRKVSDFAIFEVGR
ncbi:MAG: class I SAM-dependent methyltransferase [Candidatus Micrarchaeota archaeon]